jgi:hypothetical protein
MDRAQRDGKSAAHEDSPNPQRARRHEIEVAGQLPVQGVLSCDPPRSTGGRFRAAANHINLPQRRDDLVPTGNCLVYQISIDAIAFVSQS